jgi:hypothetical protein
MRQSIFWCVIGGGAFWLPMIVLQTIFGKRVSDVALNVAPLVGLHLLISYVEFALRRSG